ncbi:hypothetical protein FRC08_008408 [Ceratobasidium sp. 394]|nr:hypothetical protein FRC08_008408 [Ceratobasidium sp. 394]
MYVNGHQHELINQQGEYPAGNGLPGLWTYDNQGWKKPTDNALARYLQFYGIGSELLEDKDGTKVIAPGMSDRASELLKKYVWLTY